MTLSIKTFGNMAFCRMTLITPIKIGKTRWKCILLRTTLLRVVPMKSNVRVILTNVTLLNVFLVVVILMSITLLHLILLSSFQLNGTMLNVILLRVILLIVIMLRVILLTVISLNAEERILKKKFTNVFNTLEYYIRLGWKSLIFEIMLISAKTQKSWVISIEIVLPSDLKLQITLQNQTVTKAVLNFLFSLSK